MGLHGQGTAMALLLTGPAQPAQWLAIARYWQEEGVVYVPTIVFRHWLDGGRYVL